MNQLISNVLMHPTDAVERPMTLIEKLERLSDEYFNLYTAYGDNADLNCSGAVDEAINIVKQHQAESGWISADWRLPPYNMMVLAYCNIRKTTGYAFVSQQQAWSFYHFTKNSENQALAMANDISKWMPIPQPPSEVQDD